MKLLAHGKAFCANASVEAKCYYFREKLRNISWLDRRPRN